MSIQLHRMVEITVKYCDKLRAAKLFERWKVPYKCWVLLILLPKCYSWDTKHPGSLALLCFYTVAFPAFLGDGEIGNPINLAHFCPQNSFLDMLTWSKDVKKSIESKQRHFQKRDIRAHASATLRKRLVSTQSLKCQPLNIWINYSKLQGDQVQFISTPNSWNNTYNLIMGNPKYQENYSVQYKNMLSQKHTSLETAPLFPLTLFKDIL